MSNTSNTLSGGSLKSRNTQMNHRSQERKTISSIKFIDFIDLSEVIMALEMTTDQSQAYFDTKTGKIKWIYDFEPSLSDISSEDLDEKLDDESAEELAEGLDEHSNNRNNRYNHNSVYRYIPLPDQYEIYEYHMIEAFAYSRNDRLVGAITGRGAFRRFKDAVDRLGLSEEWYEFRDNCYRERAVSWCRGNGIRFTEKRKKNKKDSRRSAKSNA